MEPKKYPNWCCEECFANCKSVLTATDKDVEFKTFGETEDGKNQDICEVCGNEAPSAETSSLGYPEFAGFEIPQHDWIDPIGD